MNLFTRSSIILIGLLCTWQLIIFFFKLPPYILPTPFAVFKMLILKKELILSETLPTVIETLIGFVLGILFASLTAIFMAYYRSIRFWGLPLLIMSQAIPTFAVAPLLVIWLGYGMASKILMTLIMLFFPVASAFYDGLISTPSGFLDLATTLNAKKWRIFYYIRIPAALPQWASGVRIAAAIAPMGAIIGEWVGASQGLGFLMLNANARMQIDLMFAALFIIVIFSLALYFGANSLLNRIIFWEKKSFTV